MRPILNKGHVPRVVPSGRHRGDLACHRKAHLPVSPLAAATIDLTTMAVDLASKGGARDARWMQASSGAGLRGMTAWHRAAPASTAGWFPCG
jgi:hypothetical protein